MRNNNLNVLPFYSDVKMQDYKKWYAYGEVYPLASHRSKLLPFQISRPHRANEITAVKLINKVTGVTVDITTQAVNAGLSIKSFPTYDLIINYSLLNFPALVLNAGMYYISITDGIDTWYSDIFTVVVNLEKFLKIEYWDSANILHNAGHIDYSDNYKNYLYVRTALGKPEYPFQEEAQDRDGHLYVEKQISEKVYKFEFLAPEYLCDAIRIIRMHDFINITFEGIPYKVENIIFEPKWQEQGNIAVVDVEFQCDTVIKKTPSITTGPTENSFGTDFNNDYN